MVELRRFILDPDLDPAVHRLGTITNRLIDMANGSRTGRIWLLGDDGDRQELLGGDVIDSNNYPLRVEPGSTNQVNILHSNGSTVGLRVQDAGLTTGVPASLTSTLAVTGATALQSTLGVTGATTLQSTLAVTGASTLTGNVSAGGTLTVTGATLLNGAVTVGDAAADVVTVKGTATVDEILTLTKGLVVDTTTLVVDAVTNKVGVGVVPASTDAMATVNGAFRVTEFAGLATAGSGLEVNYVPGTTTGALTSINRSSTTFLPLDLNGSIISLKPGGTAKLVANTTGIGFFGTTPAAQPATTAAATDLPTVIALANALRTGVRAVGLFS